MRGKAGRGDDGENRERHRPSEEGRTEGERKQSGGMKKDQQRERGQRERERESERERGRERAGGERERREGGRRETERERESRGRKFVSAVPVAM